MKKTAQFGKTFLGFFEKRAGPVGRQVVDNNHFKGLAFESRNGLFNERDNIVLFIHHRYDDRHFDGHLNPPIPLDPAGRPYLLAGFGPTPFSRF